MPLISAGQMAEVQSLEVDRMVDLCSLVTRTRTSDGALGSTTVEVITEDVPCYVQPQLAGNTETLMGGQLLSGLQWKFVLPYGVVIEKDDEIIYQGSRYAVMGVLGPRSFETARRVIAVRK